MIIMKNNTKLLFEEYRIGKQVCDGYFKNMYSVISFTLLLYGALFVIKSDKISQSIEAVYLYFLPIATDILGLLFVYNIYVITKYNHYFSVLEILIKTNYYKENAEVCEFQGWSIFAKDNRCVNLVVYGTAMAFYIVLPAFDIIYGYILKNIKLSELICEKLINIFITIIPILIYAIYITSVTFIIVKILILYFKKVNIPVNIDGMTINMTSVIKNSQSKSDTKK